MTRFRAAMLATACSLVFFAIGAVAPVWYGHHPKYPGPLWNARENVTASRPVHRQNWAPGAILASVVVGVWILVFRAAYPHRRPDSARDYEEKREGSMPDGRNAGG